VNAENRKEDCPHGDAIARLKEDIQTMYTTLDQAREWGHADHTKIKETIAKNSADIDRLGGKIAEVDNELVEGLKWVRSAHHYTRDSLDKRLKMATFLAIIGTFVVLIASGFGGLFIQQTQIAKQVARIEERVTIHMEFYKPKPRQHGPLSK